MPASSDAPAAATMAFIRPSDTPALPIEAMHVLRAALVRREEEEERRPIERTHAVCAEAEDTAEQQLKKRKRQELIASLNAGQIAKAIIKNEAADRRMHALAIARRLHYCLNA
jgi:hypothetical protein